MTSKKVKKFFIKFLIGIVVFAAMLIIGKFTGWFQYYSASTSSSAPTINRSEFFFSSTLKSYHNNDLVCFKYNDFNFGKGVWVFRLCGQYGDVIEMRNGIFYLNGENFDKNLNLINQYKVSRATYYDIDEVDIKNEEFEMPVMGQDSVTLMMTTHYLRKRNIKSLIKIDTADQRNISRLKINPNRGIDNFGPIKVPKDSLFLLGDNRHNANDSRYIGFIPKKDVVSTVLFK
jgi:signal peptidase I